MKDFFSRPREFSFKDGVAVIFICAFLPLIVMVFAGYGDKWVVEVMADLMKIILTGYFVHEIARMGTDAYQNRGNKNEDHRNQPPI